MSDQFESVAFQLFGLVSLYMPTKEWERLQYNRHILMRLLDASDEEMDKAFRSIETFRALGEYLRDQLTYEGMFEEPPDTDTTH